jgi:hypothetical protein
MKIKTSTLLLTVSIVLFCASIMYTTERVSTFSCSSHVDNLYKSGSLHTDFQILIYNDDTGFIAHRGILINEKNEYIVDREIKFSIHDDNKDGIMTLESMGVVKKPNDTVPDEHMWNKVYASGIRYYPSLLKTKNGDIIIIEKAVPIYVCS